ncbi:glycoside hydrolase domain-containing protein [Caldalkalibacillus uzonensis]|uniref:glycoside hydrolase domain-containing protein n=1 Tax=Caldalkalibacillus uzonensis TaxID=353224 RepID=UPI0027D8CF3C|nr:glycoside hydrolase domain-containing protein [Caldalkalibacillus uzonensis]
MHLPCYLLWRGREIVPYEWGVDSAAPVTESFFQCVVDHFGYPSYWGRYLTTVPNVSDGLTRQEIALLRGRGVKIWPIYNEFVDAIGYRNGRVAARNSIYHAQRLGIPEGIMLTANLEYAIDEAWIRGWVDAIYPSGYRPGLYGDPAEGDFSTAYCQAVQNSNLVAAQAIIWSNMPRPGVTRRAEAPAYRPSMPPCQANVWGWQYGWDDPTCNMPIDSNLIDSKLMQYLW